ncbi:MAG: hypothetical protein PWQ77_1663 [Kosmotogales bacterium]|nr:hypothetical protein [Kosmotogales bacterium]
MYLCVGNEMEEKIYTKESLISEFKEIYKKGWIRNTRGKNHGAVGNILEDLLGIKENNLPISNTNEWELKAQRNNTNSLTTLFHFEPSPKALKFVPKIFLPKYGWPHKEAGEKYSLTEMSFRQTINGVNATDRGFKINVDRQNKKILISFDKNLVALKHSDWLTAVGKNAGLGELSPQPYWGFDDLLYKVGTKLLNCFYIIAKTKKEENIEYFWYDKVYMLKKFSFENFLNQIELGNVYIDFDARTGHNHGTKFRIKQKTILNLYSEKKTINLE